MSTGGLVLARFDFRGADRDVLFDFPHQFVDDAFSGVGNSDARSGQPHRRMFRRVAQQTADDRRDVTRSFEQQAGVVP